MKVIMYMAMSVNGIIAKENDDTPWSKEVWNSYYNLIKRKKNIILGKRTYEIMKSFNEFEKLGHPVTVVVSSSRRQEDEKTIFVSSPREAVNALKKRGFREIIVGGGSKLNASFLKDGLLDEIYLDIDPLIFGRGIMLFAETDMEVKLELLKIRKLSKNTIRLQYKVRKS